MIGKCECCEEGTEGIKYDKHFDMFVCYDCRHPDLDFCTSCGCPLGNGGCEDCMDSVDPFY